MKTDFRRAFARAIFPVAAFCLSGCLGSRPAPPACWLVAADAAEAKVAAGASPRIPARMASFSVRPPWDGFKLAVLRPDGSVAFDPANSFAAKPELMLKCAAIDILATAGGYDFNAPALGTNVVFDVTVTRFALDCRAKGLRRATVALTLAAGESEGRGRPPAPKVFAAEAGADAADGNYSAAFSRAFADALSRACEGVGKR